MEKELRKSLIIATVITSVLGTLAHFAYDWSGGNRLVGLFTAVNESTWEHMKLLFFPMLLVSLILVSLKKEEYPCLLPRLLLGNLVGTFLIPVLFYTYSGILGKNVDFINISIYYICVTVAYYIAYRVSSGKMADSDCSGMLTNVLLFVTFVLVLAFFIFTYYPPELGIFEDPTDLQSALKNIYLYPL